MIIVLCFFLQLFMIYFMVFNIKIFTFIVKLINTFVSLQSKYAKEKFKLCP